VVPKLISSAIDSFTAGHFSYRTVIIQFVVTGLGVFILTYAQNIAQTWASEKVARDMRSAPRGEDFRAVFSAGWNRSRPPNC